MTNTTTYNGWTNYETWCAKLWIDNDQGLHEYFLECAEDHIDDNDEPNAYDFGKEIEQYFDDMAEEWMPDQASFFSDLMNASLARVEWYEIAEALIEDAIEIRA